VLADEAALDYAGLLGDRLAGEPFGLGVLAAVGVDACLHLPPEHPAWRNLARHEVGAELREQLRLVVVGEGAQPSPTPAVG
jgi:hypothetical protein